MHRRNFIQTLAAGGAGATLLTSGTAEAAPKQDASVTWTVKGFTCVTCAVGLQTILERHKGIARVSAAYPAGKVQIGYDSSVIAPPEIKHLIEQAGFKVKEDIRRS
jgi:copper chaperone CopZ